VVYDQERNPNAMTTVTVRRRSALAANHSTSGSAPVADRLQANRHTRRGVSTSRGDVRRDDLGGGRQGVGLRDDDAARSRELAAFFATQSVRLRRIVSSQLRADHQTIEDACQHAWAALARCDHVTLDGRGVAWLARVAIREGWRLTAARRHEVPSDVLVDGGSGADDVRETLGAGSDDTALARIEHCDRVRDLGALKGRERRELFLQALGYGYEEIAALTGSSYTAVNRRLSEGRAQLRRLGRERHRCR
jgi:DNA-directed RNA polymerase specialized sigma24 family protein